MTCARLPFRDDTTSSFNSVGGWLGVGRHQERSVLFLALATTTRLGSFGFAGGFEFRVEFGFSFCRERRLDEEEGVVFFEFACFGYEPGT